MSGVIYTTLLEPEITLEAQVSVTNLSEVWKGRRRSDGAEVAVKFALSPLAAATLQPEADIVRALEADGVRGLVPAEYSASPVPHLVFPWKGRRTFRDLLDGIKSGDDRSHATGILLQVASTVADVQDRGFIHGDLKPENILLDDGGQPWLIDFGMARAIHHARLDSRVSRSMDESEGGWGGTLHYMPPEGLQGEAPAPSWDVYALGVMLHEVLLGNRPDRAATPEALKAALPADVVTLLLGALAYAPADRFTNVPQLMLRLRPVASELTVVGPVRLFRRAGRMLLAGLAAFFVALRYTSVLVLLAGYVALLAATFGYRVEFCIGIIAVILFHGVIRWEGPETEDEARARKKGFVLDASRPVVRTRPARKTK
ncbi:MAG: protein kinase [Planctomycetota bacterium]